MTARRSPGRSDGAESVASGAHLWGAGAIVVATVVAALALFEFRWNRSALADIASQPGGWIGAIVVVACSAVVHELLHALGFCLFGRVSWRSISFRPTWRVMGFSAHVGVAISARAYRVGAALPALLLSAVPIALGVATGAGLLVAWGLFFLLECFTDLALLLATLTVPASARVSAHPTRLGLRLVPGARADSSGLGQGASC